MTDLIKTIFILPLIILLGACTSSTADDDIPGPVSSFITTYFPDAATESATRSTGGGWIVTLSKGAQLTFDSSDEWTDINGRGETLPQMLLTDRLPERVVDYLTSMELLDGVYRLTRSWHQLRVELRNDYFVYNSQTDALTYPANR